MGPQDWLLIQALLLWRLCVIKAKRERAARFESSSAVETKGFSGYELSRFKVHAPKILLMSRMLLDAAAGQHAYPLKLSSRERDVIIDERNLAFKESTKGTAEYLMILAIRGHNQSSEKIPLVI